VVCQSLQRLRGDGSVGHRSLGDVQQHPGNCRRVSGREEHGVQLRGTDLSARESRALWLLALCELKCKNRNSMCCSGGERSQGVHEHCCCCCLPEQAVDTYRGKGSKGTSSPQQAEVRPLDMQASMLATICLFAQLIKGRRSVFCEANCLLASACKYYSGMGA
jgi:hypothetical protein